MKVGAIILAGGKSSRMGSDKGLMLLNNRPMIKHTIETLQQITDDIIIISNNSDYSMFGMKVYKDLIKDAGPLAGIYTGLSLSNHDKNIVVSCDVPFVSKELLNFLIDNCKNFWATIPVKNNNTHQVIGIYDKKCIPIFKNELANEQLKIKVALEKVNLNIVDVNQFDDREFTNVNTPNELNEIQ